MFRSLTDDDLQSAITSEEDKTFRTKLLAAGQTDPYTQIYGQVTLMFREAIRSNPANSLDPDSTTLPEACIFHAVAIIRHRLTSRFSSTVPSEARMQEYKTANDYLKAVAKPNGLAVEQWGVAESAKQQIPSPAINESPRRDGWRNQDGI